MITNRSILIKLAFQIGDLAYQAATHDRELAVALTDIECMLVCLSANINYDEISEVNERYPFAS